MRCESESDILLLCISKRIVGLVMHQEGISEKECFWMFLVLILADSKQICYTKAEGFNCVRFLHNISEIVVEVRLQKQG